MKEQSFRKLILVFAIVIILLTTGVIFYYSFGIVKGTFIFYMDATVNPDKSGMNGDTTGVHFGIIPPGGSSRKKLTVVNPKNEKLRVDIALNGDIAPYVTPSENYFYLDPREERTVSLTFRALEETPAGQYEGYGKISFKKI